jgi:hypothetical protein
MSHRRIAETSPYHSHFQKGGWRMKYTAMELGLDYFQMYDVVNQEASANIKIRGQFDNGDKQYKLLYLDWFANPVKKNKEPLFDKNAHLAMYRMFVPLIPEPTRKVEFVNQFGTQKAIIGKAFALLAPAQKIEPGSAFPKQLSHFAVYQVLEGTVVNKPVQLQDQFGLSKAVVMSPMAFAVPVKKSHDNNVFPIVNDKAHLVIYKVTPKIVQKNCAIKDQFKNSKIAVTQRILLAAPTIKRRWSVVG